jgi:hypothetical protein
MVAHAAWAAQGRPEGAWQDFLAIHAWFLGLQLLDLLTTLAVLSLGGGESSRMPAWALSAYGPGALVAIKVGVVVATAACWLPAMAWLGRQAPAVRSWAVPAVLAALLLATLSYSGIVVHNLANVHALAQAR